MNNHKRFLSIYNSFTYGKNWNTKPLDKKIEVIKKFVAENYDTLTPAGQREFLLYGLGEALDLIEDTAEASLSKLHNIILVTQLTFMCKFNLNFSYTKNIYSALDLGSDLYDNSRTRYYLVKTLKISEEREDVDVLCGITNFTFNSNRLYHDIPETVNNMMEIVAAYGTYYAGMKDAITGQIQFLTSPQYEKFTKKLATIKTV